MSASNQTNIRCGKTRHDGIGDSNAPLSSFKQLPRVHSGSVLCLTPVKGGLCMSGGSDSIVQLTSISSGQVKEKWTGHDRDVTKVVYGSAGDLYFSSSRDKTIGIWHRSEKLPYQRCIGHDLVVTGITVNNDNSVLCSGSRDNSIRLWDVSTGRCTKTSSLAQNLITNVRWAHQLNVIAQSGEDKEFRLWDARTLSIVSAFPRKQYIQTYCDVSQDNNYCVTSSNGFGGNGCEATLWDVRMKRLVHEFKGHQETVCCCCFIPCSVTGTRKVIATTSNDCSIRLWDQDTKECLDVVTVSGSGPLTSIAAFEDGNVCVSSFNVGIQLFRLITSPASVPSLVKTAEF